MPKKKVSRAEVARLAGVSPQTVSRVSSNDPNVKDSTRQRVLEVIKQLGYHPNRAARALKYGKTHMIGVAIFDIIETGNALTLKGITQAATEAGYMTSLMLFSSQKKLNISSYLKQMHSLSVDAAIVVLEQLADDLDDFAIPPGMNVVLVSSKDTACCPVVDADQQQGARLAVQYLLKHGHETVHFVAGPPSSLSSQARQETWRQVLTENGCRLPQVIVGDWSGDSGYRAGLQLAQDPSCSAVFAANDIMAYGVIQGLREGGKQVPQEVSVVGFDDALGRTIPNCSLTTIRQDFEATGRMAAMRAIADNEDGSRQQPLNVQVPVELIERETAAPAPATA